MQEYFFIRADGQYRRVDFQEIQYVEACKNYLKIVTGSGYLLVLITMKKMEDLLPSCQFRRVHKSFIIALNKMAAFDSEHIYLKDKIIPIGAQFRNTLQNSVTILQNSLRPLKKKSGVYQLLPTISHVNP